MALKGAATGAKAAYAGFVELVGANRRCNCPSKPINVVDAACILLYHAAA